MNKTVSMQIKYDFVIMLYKHLKEFLKHKNPNIKTSRVSSDIISLYFGDQKLLIIDAIIDDKESNGRYNHIIRKSDDTLIFFDQDFATIAKIINFNRKKEFSLFITKPINSFLFDIINTFVNKSNQNKKDKLIRYNQLPTYHLKLFFNKMFNFHLHPNDEFCLIDGHLRHRWGIDKRKISKTKPIQVLIEDQSAYLFNDGDKYWVSLKPCNQVIIGNKIYYELKNSVIHVKTTKTKADSYKYDKNGNIEYYRLKNKRISKQRLNKENFLTFKSILNSKFLLIYDNKCNQYFLFDDKKRKIMIEHPDLLLRIKD